MLITSSTLTNYIINLYTGKLIEKYVNTPDFGTILMHIYVDISNSFLNYYVFY
jgi:hypothetical protein